MPIRHDLARCCWCKGHFIQVDYLGKQSWLCETPECQDRQLEKALIVSVTEKGQTKDKCLYVPLPKQVEFEDSVKESKRVLFGGAAGGSKSHALRWFLYRQCLTVPRFKALLMRRNMTELERTHINEAEFEARDFQAVLNKSKHTVRFPNDSELTFGHLDDPKDVSKHLSTEYEIIAFDELVTFPEREALLIMSRARTTKAYEPRVIAGTNPGGPEAFWVKSRWINKNLDPREHPNYNADDYTYIPSRLEDNPYLDRLYEDSLLDLPEELRRAYRDGDWEIFPGQFFQEWRRAEHVVPEGPLPEGRWYIAVDWGYMAPGVALFICVTSEGRAIVAHEYVFKATIASEVAKNISNLARQMGIHRITGPGDTEMWKPQTDTGESIAETFARFNVHLNPADKERVNGWQRLRHWLRPAEDGLPWLQVRENCNYLARTLPSLIMDEKFPEDIADGLEDHACLVGGTLVQTAQGLKTIQSLSLVDKVWTRQGLRRVTALAETDKTAEVFDLVLSNGVVLRTTANHPIWRGDAFVRADRLRYGDILETWQDGITDKHDTCGQSILGVSPLNTTFTTKTAILATMLLRTWNAFRRLSIYPFTGHNDQRGIVFRFGRLVKRQKSGTDQRLVERGIGNMVSGCGRLVKQWLESVRSVVRSFQTLLAGNGQGFVLMPASPVGGERVGGTMFRDAAIVGNSSQQTNTLRLETVPPNAVRVVGFYPAGTAVVYNLSVEAVSEYYANGVLVSNCDALRYFAMARPAPETQWIDRDIPVGSPAWLLKNDKKASRVRLDGQIS